LIYLIFVAYRDAPEKILLTEASLLQTPSSFAREKPPALTHVISSRFTRSRVAARKEDFTATGPELEAAPGLNYKIAQKTAEIEPKSNQVRKPKMK
jgi:hypothetical protein